MIFDPPMWPARDFWKAHNIQTFIQQHTLCERLGLAPQIVRICGKPYVTRESAIEWRERIARYASEHGGEINL